MKKIITILLVFISLTASAQFKSNKEADKYAQTVPLVIDSAYNNSAKGKKEKAEGVHFKFIHEIKNTVTGEIIPIEYTLWQNGRWTGKRLPKEENNK